MEATTGRAKARIPVHFFYDEESENWGFRVAELHIIGGGQATLEEARQAAAEAIAFSLEGEGPGDSGDQVEYLDVAVG